MLQTIFGIEMVDQGRDGGLALMRRPRGAVRSCAQEQLSINRSRFRDLSDWFNYSFLKSPSMFKENML
jgi:hypothetical protein